MDHLKAVALMNETVGFYRNFMDGSGDCFLKA